jgi:hypothetical protein
LLAIGVSLAAAGARRALFVVALVPVAFAPFAYARLRLHRTLGRLLAARHMAWITALGGALDAVMATQLLTARSADIAAWVSGPAVGWVGPVWFSAHALLFLGYAGLGLVRALRRLLQRVVLWSRPAVSAVGSGEAGSGGASSCSSTAWSAPRRRSPSRSPASGCRTPSASTSTRSSCRTGRAPSTACASRTSPTSTSAARWTASGCARWRR